MNLLTRCLLLVLFAVCGTIPLSGFAQDHELKYGLIGHDTANAGNPYRIDATIMFAWNRSSELEIAAASNIEWKGQILIRDTVPHQFHAELAGNVSVTIDKHVEALKANAKERSWVSGSLIDLSPGFHDVTITYEADAASSESVVKLFWSSELFPIEPIPAHVLFHENNNAQVMLIEEGRQLFEAHRCHRCHPGTGDVEALPAPALWGVNAGLNPEWLLQKMLDKNPEAPHSKMPNFGLSLEEAECITAYLLKQTIPFEFESVPKQKPENDHPDGSELLHSLGCLACHIVNDLGTVGPFGGGDLSRIGEKRSPAWLATWLDVPDRMNPQHRMPVFQLTPSERRLLVETLSALKDPALSADSSLRFSPQERPDATKAERGRQLMKDYRCANCHKIPAVEADLRGYPDLKQPVKDWKRSCLSDVADPARHRPIYSHTNRDALKAYLVSQFETPRSTEANFLSESDYELGQHVLERRNCLACHPRGTSTGIVETAGQVAQKVASLKGASQALIPPNLTAVGDKLTDAVFHKSLSGSHERVRANWLKVRMPKFQHSKQDLNVLKTYLVEQDRIPKAGVAVIPEVNLPPDERLLIGRQLVGAGGFSCIACHQVGDYAPRNVALGTRGSDLLNIQERIRPEFYHRWTHAPLRVVTGMEMPSYQKPVAGLLKDDVQAQLTALWNALGDPNFTPPTNPTQVEQLLQLQPGDSPRIVRDVFTVAETNGGGFAARAFAIGFDNQLSLLFDLDTATIREWRFGDFARERTEGKSWFWDLAGVQLATGFNAQPELVLVKDGEPAQVIPWELEDPARLSYLSTYEIFADGISLHYQLKVKVTGKSATIQVSEKFATLDRGEIIGVSRQIAVTNLPTGYTLGWHNKSLKTEYIRANIIAQGDSLKKMNSERGEVILFDQQKDAATLTLHYEAKCKPLPGNRIDLKNVYPNDSQVTTLPGYVGTRLKLPMSIMPTAISWDHAQETVFTSLKGHVYKAIDTDADGFEDQLVELEEGLPAPFGILADGNDLLIGHKAELLRLHSPSKDNLYQREVVADGWGYTDNYHDWLTGPVRDDEGNLYVGTGSDYSQGDRNKNFSKWRGKIIKVDTSGNFTPFSHELRYPQGMATDAQGRLFASDQQGVQNTQNEIVQILEGHYYGVPALLDEALPERETRAAIQVPHPWTRSVNGIFFLPTDLDSPYAGHGIGCEYNGKFLIRVSFQEVNEALQGATYPYSKQEWKSEDETFLGPICGAVSKSGDIYIGSIYDSGWLGGPNTGEIVRLKRAGEFPNGLREVRATSDGFELEFVKPVDAEKSLDQKMYSISGSTRSWKGSYATEPTSTYAPTIEQVMISEDGKTVTLHLNPLKPNFVYEINIGDIGADGEKLFPVFASYSLNELVP